MKMTWATEPVELCDEKVVIRPLRPEEVPEVARALHDPEGWYAKNWVFEGINQVEDFLKSVLASQAAGRCNPFVYTVNGEIAGVTRFHRIDERARTFEIGGTWIVSKWKRTFVNTRVKRMLLAYAFEKLGAIRVELRVNSRNYNSQMNVLRLGAKFEGKLTGSVYYPWMTQNPVQDGLIYSFTQADWKTARARLNALVERTIPVAKYLPSQIDTPRFRLRHPRLSESSQMLDLMNGNRQRLLASFPQQAEWKTEEDVRAWTAEKAHQAAAGEVFVFSIWEKGTEKLVGQLALKSIDWKAKTVEVGYYVDSERTGQGIASESVARAKEMLLEAGFNRIFVRILTDNAASVALAKKMGFEFEGIQRSAFLAGTGALSDVSVWGLVRASSKEAHPGSGFEGRDSAQEGPQDDSRRTSPVSLRCELH